MTALTSLLLILAVYLIGLATGVVLGRRKGRAQVTSALWADPVATRALAARVEDAHFTARAADAQRRVQGLAPRPPD